MTDRSKTCNGFQGGPDRAAHAGPLSEWTRGRTILTHLDEIDLREMSKFEEAPNLFGLAAYSIERPAPPDWRTRRTPRDSLTTEQRALLQRRELARHPLVRIDGRLALGSSRPVPVALIVSQQHVRLAAGFRAMVGPAVPADPPPAAFTLLVWAEPVRTRRGTNALEERIDAPPGRPWGILVGYDDPELIAEIMLDALEANWTERSGAPELVRPATDTDHRSPAEPVFVEPDGRTGPVWANPLIPARRIGARAAWRRATAQPGAMLFGVDVDEDGHVPLLEASGRPPRGGAVIVPRTALLQLVPKESPAPAPD